MDISIPQIAQTLFYLVTSITLIAAGVLGIVKYRVFRVGQPFITVTLDVTSRPCSSEHIQVGVAARLYNGSKVLARIYTLEWECRGLATYDPDEIEAKITEYFSSNDGRTRTETGNPDFPWNLQQRITKTDLDIRVEPNEASNDSATFIVPYYCNAVQVRLFIPVRNRRDWGWTAVAYHDITIPPKEES